MPEFEYTGRDNLEVMRYAVRYNKYLTNLILTFARTGDSIIDFGAGNGTFSVPVRSAGYHVTCLETDLVLSSALTDNGFTVFNNLERVADGSVDYIYSLNVLEHIEDDARVAAHWHRKLKPGGRLLVYVPAFQILFSRMDYKVGHFRRYTTAGLVQTLTEAGFKIDHSRYADSIGFVATLIYKLFEKGDGTVDIEILKYYDRWIFPLSRLLDSLTHRFFGKNVYAYAIKSE